MPYLLTAMKRFLIIGTLILISFKSFSQGCIGTAGQVKWSYWANFDLSPDSNALFAREFYPETPDGFQMLPTLAAPRNYTEYFAGMMRGFIKVPVTATYYFNVTGDDEAIFFLSPNQAPASKIKRAEAPEYTEIDQHDKSPLQTSQAIQLVAGQYYYFELLQFEGGYSDHATLWWKKSTDTSWSVVDYNYIFEYACNSNCPPRGTVCNDNNPGTTNDVQDGFCNCVGTAPKPSVCVGEKGVLQAYYYDNIPGSYVENDLINAPKFPLLPDRMEKLKGAYGPLQSYVKEYYGTLVQGYLTVPVSGNYEFNLTGDNQTFFFLSKNDSIQYKQNHQIFSFYGLGEYEHNSSVLQNSGPIFMEKGKYYYFEFRHKQNTWRDHFNLFWKTPFHPQKTWKRIPEFYIYDYDCEVSCIAENTPCDDGNPFTNNDKIDANCNCVGTPCSGPDCDDLGAKYQLYEDCSPTNNLNPIEEATWQSCTAAPNPNPARSTSTHWIKYNFSDIYKFKNSRVWNYNVQNQTTKGFRQVVVDYSVDGTTWNALGGTYNWPQAPGVADYGGFIGPNFNDVKAKYILISALNNYGDPTCSGFAKITIDATMCNPKDTPCDDGDPLTSYDKFDNNCNCRGVDISCGTDTLLLGKFNLDDSLFAAKKRVEAASIVPNTQNISFTAGNSIVLLPGFEVKNQGVFSATIADCIQQQFITNELKTQVNTKDFSIQDQDTAMKKIVFRLNEPGFVILKIRKNKGTETVVTLMENYQENLGTQIKYVPTRKFEKGKYEVYLKINNNEISEFFEIK